jgi:Fe-S-cluster-containing dehydrogenase component
MKYDERHKNVFKCDLCDGDPICVKFCQYDAIRYNEPEEMNYNKQLTVAERISDTIGDEERVLRII